MSGNEQTYQPTDGMDISKIALVTIVGSIIVLVIILFTRMMYFDAQRSEDLQKYILVEPAQREAIWAKQRETLQGARWVKREENIAAIPIGEAMKLTLQDLGAETSSAAEDAEQGVAPGEPSLEDPQDRGAETPTGRGMVPAPGGAVPAQQLRALPRDARGADKLQRAAPSGAGIKQKPVEGGSP